jgi:hypothetical protein
MTNKGMAKDTLDILARKYYINGNNEKISIENELEASAKGTVLFSSEELAELAEKEFWISILRPGLKSGDAVP